MCLLWYIPQWGFHTIWVFDHLLELKIVLRITLKYMSARPDIHFLGNQQSPCLLCFIYNRINQWHTERRTIHIYEAEFVETSDSQDQANICGGIY